MASVTYTIELTSDNFAKIENINRILSGDSDRTEAKVSKVVETLEEIVKEVETEVEKELKSLSSVSGGQSIANEIGKVKVKVKEEVKSQIPLSKLKAAVKIAKHDHGEDFVFKVIKDDLGIEPNATLGRTLSKIAPDEYDKAISLLNAGPKEDFDLLDEDDLFEDSKDSPVITPEAVKIALKAYVMSIGRDEAREIMVSGGANKMRDLGDCSQEQLKSMFAKLVI